MKKHWWNPLSWGTKSSGDSFISQLLKLNNASWSGRTYVAFATEAFRDNSTVRACLQHVNRAAKSLPIKLVDPSGKVVPKHPILDLLKHPNNVQTGANFIENAVTSRFLGGEAPILALRISENRPPDELWVLRPDWLQAQRITNISVDYWTYSPAESQSKLATTIPPEDLFMWAEFNPLEPMRGMSVLWSVAKEIDILNQYNVANKSLLDNGVQPSGVFSTAQELKTDPFNRLKAQIDEKYSGAGNNGRPLLLEGGLAWQTSGLTMRDAEFLGGTKQSQLAVCRTMGVPEQIMGFEGSKTFANYETARAALYEDTAIPLVNDLLLGFLNWLAPCYKDLAKGGYTLCVDVDSVPALEVRRTERNKAVDTMTSLKINEKRQAMGYEDDPDGDVILVDASKVPLELAGADVPMGTSAGGTGNAN